MKGSPKARSAVQTSIHRSVVMAISYESREWHLT
jgi:hypothetical protein